MAKLVTAILARNEAGEDRYLRRVLARCREFSDEILVIDDGSTDNTYDVAINFGCAVRTRDERGFWERGNEMPARKMLWETAATMAGDGWVLICDADMLLQGDPCPLTQSWEAAGWAFPLADCWNSEDTFRIDGPWAYGPATPRPWLFRPSVLQEPAIWPERCIHTGHAPLNFFQHAPCFVAPPDVYWLHLAYVKPEHRKLKHAQYTQRADLTEFERMHAESIAD